MDFDAIANTVSHQFVTVWNAPIPSFAALIASWIVIRWFIGGQYETRLANADSKLALAEARVTDYERKLAGATPDEARDRIAALEKQVGEMPRRRKLSDDQRAAIKSVVLNRGPFPSPLLINHPEFSEEAARYASQIASAFTDAGWPANVQSSFQFPRIDDRGITLGRHDDTTDLEARLVIEGSLAAAGIAFDTGILPDDFGRSLYLFVDAADD